MWLVGVVIRRYIDILIIIINFPYSTCIRSFFGRSILTSLFIFKCFFGLFNIKSGRDPVLALKSPVIMMCPHVEN